MAIVFIDPRGNKVIKDRDEVSYKIYNDNEEVVQLVRLKEDGRSNYLMIPREIVKLVGEGLVEVSKNGSLSN